MLQGFRRTAGNFALAFALTILFAVRSVAAAVGDPQPVSPQGTIIASPCLIIPAFATGSEAATFPPPGPWGSTVQICCGNGLGLDASPVVAANVTWQYSTPGSPSWNALSGAGWFSATVNAASLPDPGSSSNSCPTTPTSTLFRAVLLPTIPTCPQVVTNTVTATVFPPTQGGTLSASPQPICSGSGSNINLTGSVGTVTWCVQPNCSGPCGSAGAPPPNTLSFPTGPLTTTTCYQATVQSGSCLPPVTQTVQVNVVPVPVAGTVVAASSPICPGQASVLTASGQMNGTLQWLSCPATSLGACPPSSSGACPPSCTAIAGATGNSTQDTGALSGNICYAVEVSSPGGVCPAACSTPTAVDMLQFPPPNPSITGPFILCPGKTAVLERTPLLGGTFQWFLDGPGPPLLGGAPSITINQPGNYWVTETNGCVSARSNLLTVALDPFAVAIKGPCCACNGQQVTLCATFINGTGLSYSWTPGGQTLPCIPVSPATTTTYTVTVTDLRGCTVTSVPFTVTVCP
jgi:hypothetical protein